MRADRSSLLRAVRGARSRAIRPALACLPFAAPDLEAAPRALERPVPPLHRRPAAQAALGCLGSGLTGHRLTVAREEDGYDDPRGAVAERLGRGLQSLVQRFESARRLYPRSPGAAAGRSKLLSPGSPRSGDAHRRAAARPYVPR